MVSAGFLQPAVFTQIDIMMLLIGGIIMVDILHTLVLLPISQGAVNLLIEEYPDATVEDDCLFIISRGSGIADVLIDVSRKFKEVFEVRHIYSSELHTAIYVVHYKNGVRTHKIVMECLWKMELFI